MEDWAEIRRLHRAEGLPIKLIARTLGISRNTVRAAVASEGPPRYVRKPAGSAVDGFEDAIRAQLAAVPNPAPPSRDPPLAQAGPAARSTLADALQPRIRDRQSRSAEETSSRSL